MPAPSVHNAPGPADGAIQLKGQALLAGRKLLLADDSATIQKVIDLTFADEGVQVVSVSNGQEAIDRLLDFAPDVVLADVFMPSRNGYEVCEYVKTNEQLKHIPVMLLVGSFEPFDEAEARRVGADDILTKPFQSIRRLIDRVGALVSSPPVEKESPTVELPKLDEPVAEERMEPEELEVTTADTLRLSEEDLAEMPAKVEQPVSATESSAREEKMETGFTEPVHDSQADSSDVLLDLGEFEPVRASADDFVLELDDEVGGVEEVAAAPVYEAAPAYEPVPAAYEPAPASYDMRTFVEPQVTEAPVFEDTQSVSSVSSADKLSPEMIDAIARRAVELMSDKVIREIAWEVVPDLAELLIKRQLEEKQSQAK